MQIKNYACIPHFDSGKIVSILAVANKQGDYDDVDVSHLSLFMDSMWKIVKQRKANEEIKQAKLKAERSDRLKTRFLNNMSHEVRTPLNGLLGFSQLITKEGLPPEKQKKYSGIILSSGQQLSRIIDDILEVSQLDEHQIKVYESNFSINTLIMELKSVFDLVISSKPIKITAKLALPHSNSYIVADRSKINKILSNLIENAIKFTSTGGVEIGYCLMDDCIEFFVKDTGIGIASKETDKIFDRFYQADNSALGLFGGLGLGLAIAKENAELLKGTIRVESVVGEGTTFFVRIPYMIPESQETFVASKDMLSNSGNYLILVVEDEDDNRLFVGELLNHIEINNTHVFAKNGIEAIEICQTNGNIDLVLMDLKMPVMDGFEATKEIKKIRPYLPVVALTAYSTDEDINKAKNSGCDRIISKPIELDIFEKTLLDILKR